MVERRHDRRRTERTPAEILEEHGRESISRINKIDRWVRLVSKRLLQLAAVTLATVLGVAVITWILVGQIDSSRYETAVKGCQINRQATHDGLLELMQELAKGDELKRQRAKELADRHFPSDIASCKRYARKLGLAP